MNRFTKKLISCLIPTHNGLELLRQNLPPLVGELGKSRLSYEIIVVDDCSTDKTPEWLGKFKKNKQHRFGAWSSCAFYL